MVADTAVIALEARTRLRRARACDAPAPRGACRLSRAATPPAFAGGVVVLDLHDDDADAREGVRHHADQRAVAQADERRCVETFDEPTGLFLGEHRRLVAFDDTAVKGGSGSHPEKTGGPWSDRFTPASRHSLFAHQPSAMGGMTRRRLSIAASGRCRVRLRYLDGDSRQRDGLSRNVPLRKGLLICSCASGPATVSCRPAPITAPDCSITVPSSMPETSSDLGITRFGCVA